MQPYVAMTFRLFLLTFRMVSSRQPSVWGSPLDIGTSLMAFRVFFGVDLILGSMSHKTIVVK